MRTILLIAAVLTVITLAVGGVSAHDGDQDTDRMSEMMDQCMEMAGQMGGMMSEPMDGQERSETTDTADHHNGEMASEEPTHTGMMGC